MNIKPILFFTLLFVACTNLNAQPLQETVAGNNQFSFELMRELYKPGEDLFFSSYSLSGALAMTRAGANGTTASEMDNVLHYPGDSVHAGFKSLNQHLKQISLRDTMRLDIANALWSRIPMKETFRALTEKYYGAAVYPLTTEQPINDWAARNTNNRIPLILAPGAITPDVAMVLTNAIYFKGNWATQFDENLTAEAPFFRSDKSEVPVKMMSREGYFNYHETKNYQMLSIPYKGNGLSMVVILPEKNGSLTTVLAALSSIKVEDQLMKSQPTKAHVWLPRFEMNTSYELVDPMKKLGMPAAFMQDADFSGIPKMMKNLWIGGIIQKAFVGVTEKGTEAAAVTAVIMVTLSSIQPREPEPVKIFRADHPFIFLIRDNETGCILFSGISETPSI